MEEHHVARRVAGTMDHLQGQVAYGHGVAILEPAVGLEHLAMHSEARAIILQPRDPEPIGFLRPLNRQAEFPGEDAGLPAMIGMAVGDKDLLQRHAVVGGGSLQAVKIASRIDQCALHRGGAPDERAVLLE